jgi:hypothetical protein
MKTTTPTSTTKIKQILDPEDAETHNVETVELIGRRQYPWTKNSSASDNPINDKNNKNFTSSVSSPRLKLVARRVILLNHQRRQQSEPMLLTKHRRKSSKPSELLNQISHRGKDSEASKRTTAPIHKENSEMDAPLYRAAGIWTEGSSNDEDDEEVDTLNESIQSALLPYRRLQENQQQYGSIPMHTTMAPNDNARMSLSARLVQSLKRTLRNIASCCCCCCRACHPYRVWQWFYRVCICSFFTTLAIPLFILAWILYYGLGNPEFDFLPARLSWCLNFLGRQIITLELARISMWIFLDMMVLGNHRLARFWGPVVTMTALQARGWPFVVTAWAIWDLLLLHGDNRTFMVFA